MFKNVLFTLIIFTWFHSDAAQTTSPSCRIGPDLDIKGPPGVPGRPGSKGEPGYGKFIKL